MTEIDYGTAKGVADEPNWMRFVQGPGEGELVAPLITRQGVRNADFLFRRGKVVAELKILQTEFTRSGNNFDRIGAIAAKHGVKSLFEPSPEFQREVFDVLCRPLQRIVTSANRQIRETKAELGLEDFYGMLLCVNDGFKGMPPGYVYRIISHILAGTSYSQIDCFVYLTNHYVEIPGNPYASLLWTPSYAPGQTEELVNFVNDLGRRWHDYTEAETGPFDYRSESDHIDLSSIVVAETFRRFPIADDNNK
jgi:hypothetical protein